MSEFYTNVVVRKNKVLLRGYLDGKRYKQVAPFKPYLFVPTTEESKYRTIHGAPVKRMDFNNIREAKNFYYEYKDVENFNIYGMDRFEYLFIYENFRNCQPQTNLIKSAIFDIEVSTKDGYPDIAAADAEITAITIDYDNIIIAFGYYDYKPTDKRVKYIKCKDEADLLTKFLALISSDAYAPDVISGWHIEGFDIPYAVNRIIRILGEEAAKKMSPWGMLEQKSLVINGQRILTYVPVGVAILDYMHIYKKFVAVTKPQESYALDHIAYVELGERKLDYSEYGSLQELYENDHPKFMDYNVRDCTLIRRIDKKQNLFDLIYYIAYSSGANFTDALGTVTTWDTAIHSYLLDRCVVIEKNKDKMVGTVAGGFVKDPITGMHDWIISFDLTSLYPHLIMQYNIGPDTARGFVGRRLNIDEAINTEGLHEYHEYLQKNNVALAANGYTYTREKKSFLSSLMEDLFNERAEIKKQMLELKKQKQETGDKSLDHKISELDVRQYALKVRLNSAYGALGNQYFRWYDVNMAESITLSGQLTIKWAEKKINELLNRICKTTAIDYVIAVDTDSVYVNMSSVLEAYGSDDPLTFLDKFAQKVVEPHLQKIFEELATHMNAYRQAMHMKREAIADRGVFKKKKMYMLSVLDNEGVRYAEPDLKIMGIECVRSSTPSSCKDAIKKAVKIILSGTEKELQQFISEYRKEFEKLPIAEIASPRSANNLSKFRNATTIYNKKTDGATPIAVRGALLHNYHLKKLGLDKKYKEIWDGEKVKFIYLKIPNPIQEDVISFIGSRIPPELDLDKYIDYDTQFEKAFLNPIRNIIAVIGWQEEEINTLEDMFE